MQRNQLSKLSNTATRIVAGDDKTTYDRTSIALHWLTAVLVLTQFVLAQVWGFAPRPTKHLLIVAHMSFGILLTAVLLLRVLWRLSPGHQTRPASTGWIELAAKAVHYLLYALLISVAVLGFVLRWSGNESMSFFGLPIKPPFAPFSKPAHHNVGEAHELAGWAIIVLAALHAAAALFHHFFLRDNVLVRMLPILKKR
ncbi:cytochrome b [Caballeronia zhejiangensis]|jgi:cytochrome b561|uniref:cytochrome b n=1 Tax=Caballeronia zhejiangensis TaxID=871203 RepID=UPI001FD56086|nr:cytochrome b/b6 domain-containing protein [Caballeronia zhejiangensis]